MLPSRRTNVAQQATRMSFSLVAGHKVSKNVPELSTLFNLICLVPEEANSHNGEHTYKAYYRRKSTKRLHK